MNSMGPWTPEAISRLTPLQLLCLGHARPPVPRDEPDEDDGPPSYSPAIGENSLAPLQAAARRYARQQAAWLTSQ